MAPPCCSTRRTARCSPIRACPLTIRTRSPRRRSAQRGVDVSQYGPDRPLNGPRPSGTVLARFDLQDGGRRWRRSKKASSRPTSRSLPRLREFNGNVHKCWKAGGHGTLDLRHAIEGRATSTSTRSATWSASTRSTSGRRRSASGSRAESICRTRYRHRAFHRLEAADDRREVVRGRDDVGGNRAGTGDGDADVDGGLHGDARQRRHPCDAAPAESGRRWQRLEAGAGAGAAIDRSRSGRPTCKRSGTVCGWS